jgi:hypothetical protein
MVFRQLIGRDPDVIAGEIDVLPAKRGEMGEEVIGNVLDLAHGGDRSDVAFINIIAETVFANPLQKPISRRPAAI